MNDFTICTFDWAPSTTDQVIDVLDPAKILVEGFRFSPIKNFGIDDLAAYMAAFSGSDLDAEWESAGVESWIAEDSYEP